MKKFLFVLLLASSALPGMAQNELWVKTYSSPFDEWAASVEVIPKGGFLFAGYNQILSSTGRILAMKVNSSGKIVWANGYREGLKSSAQGRLLKNGNFLLWGKTVPMNDTSDDAFISLLSQGGKILSQWAYGVGSDTCYSLSAVEQTKDGGYIGCGSAETRVGRGYLDSKGWIVKVSSSGKIIFQMLLANKGKYKYFSLNDIHQTTDRGYVCVGSCQDDSRIWVGKLDAAGNIRMAKTYREKINGDLNIGNIIPTKDGGYFLTGNVYGSDSHGSWCAKLTATGSMKWGLRLNDAYVADGIATSDGGFLIAGQLPVINVADIAWFAKLTESGKVSWQRSYKVTDVPHFLYSAKQLGNGGYALAGRANTDTYDVNNQPVQSYAVLFMTTDSNGLTLPGLPPEAYLAGVETFKLLSAAPYYIKSNGTAIMRKSKFVPKALTLHEISWGGDSASYKTINNEPRRSGQ
jgi:hypothetical protein